MNSKFIGHICMILACSMWGLMAPLGKHAMTNGISGIEMAAFRMIGGAICFWIASLFAKKEHVRSRDMLGFFFAGLLGIVRNQCSFTIGLSLTSPVDASIITTTMPIVVLVLAAIFLKEPVTSHKVLGIFFGSIGASILILAGRSNAEEGNLLGDILCLLAQCCFAVYLTIFKKLISRYNVITCMKWMITYAAIVILPFSYHRISLIPYDALSSRVIWETSFVVVCGTFLAYIFMMNGQKRLKATSVSMYNYVQPIVSCIVSICLGLGVFGWLQAIAVVLVFSGVYLVTKQ